MFSGALCAIIWSIYIQPSTGIDSVILAMILNFIAVMVSHYLLREKGGWIGIKDESDLKQIRQKKAKKLVLDKLFKDILRTNIFEYCNKKYLPKNERRLISILPLV